MSLKPKQKSIKNLVYKCNNCGNLKAIIKNEAAPYCDTCQKNNNKQTWLETKREIVILTKNIKEEIERRKNISDKISDHITKFCGNIYFIYIHIIWFGIWLGYNFVAENPFDPYPFGALTLVVSLEAILLATFILISQSKQGEINDLRSEADYQVDLKTEKKLAETIALLKVIYENINSKKEN